MSIQAFDVENYLRFIRSVGSMTAFNFYIMLFSGVGFLLLMMEYQDRKRAQWSNIDLTKYIDKNERGFIAITVPNERSEDKENVHSITNKEDKT